MAALYHERREIGTAFDEVKTHLRGAHIVLRCEKLHDVPIWTLTGFLSFMLCE